MLSTTSRYSNTGKFIGIRFENLTTMKQHFIARGAKN